MHTENKIASLDIGSNTVMLLMVSHNRRGKFEILDEFGGVSRLVEGLNETRYISPEAMKRTLDLCEETVNIAKNYGVGRIIATTTSSIKNALNKTEFLVSCQNRFHIFPQVLTEKEEAAFIYKGASIDYSDQEKPIVVIETGGLNTQISYGTKDILLGSRTIEIGHLSYLFSMKNRLFSIYKSSFRSLIKTVIKPVIYDIEQWLDKREPLIICSGNIATKYAKTLITEHNFTREKINNIVSNTNELENTADTIRRIPPEKRNEMFSLDQARSDTFHNGLYLISRIMKLLNSDVFHITTNGLRTGILKNYIGSVNL